MEKHSKDQTRLIRFLGGTTSYYVLGLLIMLALVVYFFQKIGFIFKPFFVIFATTLAPVLFALVLYYLLDPLIKQISRKLPRNLSVTIVYVIILFLIGLGSIWLIPFLEQQTQALITSFPDLFNDFIKMLKDNLAQTPFADTSKQFFASIDDLTANFTSFIGNYWESGAQSIGNIFSAVTSTFITLFTGPIIAFFLLRDPHKFYQSVLGIIPPKFRTDFRTLTKIANQQLGDFLKGQIIASFILGAVYWVTFLVIGLQFASILAIAAGILCIIPYIGPFIAFFPGLFIAFQDSTFMAVKFVLVWFIVQLLHGDLVIPRVMGNRLQVHPITILIVLLVMGDLLGLMGVVFGIPIYTLVKLFVVFTFKKFKQRYNKYYGDQGVYQKADFSEKDYFEKD
ncbi:AI-2E family transporter [Enterococcus villorum]|uniref:AI-2E family transporter n=1 Tax=Enterococcus villorum TaxID=112904 RepID=A0A1V8YCN5_9ENTE|nr:AI-2E family transporter [Enterococcus villorum]OQO70332.1 AI-2E family transporter [Enterococcus villorum]OQO77213.1 AI-2E family transporter [Enterococcus villorum]